jgi:hypothetical protein
MFLAKSSSLHKLLELALTAAEDIQSLLQEPFSKLVTWLLTVPACTELRTLLFDKLLEGSTKTHSTQ